jgi:diaminopimelate decarboxylase
MSAPTSAGRTPMLPLGVLPQAVVEAVHRLATAGDAPVSAYLYCPEVAARRAELLRAALPPWAEVFYAVKANSFPPVLRALASAVDGFDVASHWEGELATASVAALGRRVRLVASGPGKSVPTLAGLIRLDVELINVESELELHRVARFADAAGRRLRVALRVNPPAVALTDALRFGGTPTPFGIAHEDVPAALAVAARLPALQVVGFHFHEICNNLDAEGHAAYVRWCLEWSARMAAAHGVDLQVVDVGGGFGVAREGRATFDLELFARRLLGLDPPEGTRVAFEPGRWLVDDCGFYAAEVTDLKRTHGSWFAVLRGGINHFLRPASYGALHNFTVIPLEPWPHACPRREVRDAPVTVVGELCTPADVLARDVTVDRIRPGDVVVFPSAGSYGWEMALQEFLGHPPARRLTVGSAGDLGVRALPDPSAAGVVGIPL